jgi:hypothetical protein
MLIKKSAQSTPYSLSQPTCSKIKVGKRVMGYGQITEILAPAYPPYIDLKNLP